MGKVDAELAEKIAGLFTEEQKSVLEFTQGNRTMTLNKQILYYYEGKYTVEEDEERFLDGFCIIIDSNLVAINKLAKYKEYCDVLANKEAYKDRRESVGEKEGTAKKRGVVNTQQVSEDLSLTKQRGGTTQRSEDYDGIEELYELEDKREMESDIQVNFKMVDFSNKIEQMKQNPIGRVPQPNDKFLSTDKGEVDALIAKKKEEIEEMPSWNMMQTGSGREKARHTSLSGREYGLESFQKGNELHMEEKFMEAKLAMQAMEADVANVRTRFWLSFAYLFKNYPTCL